ncbi:MAG: M15 family metallopeptidase [Verrucomicrobia bacterium]|nr:M15 family metallopeptidase [Verrucomicrobiota bacterium]
MDELLQESLQQSPHIRGEGTSDFVDLSSLDEDILFDIRYATDNNFVGHAVYSQPKAFLQRKVAAALLKAHKRLQEQGFGLIVYDAYRPWHITWLFWQATPDGQKIFVADPADGSKHNRGAAIDVGMYNLKTEQPVEFPSGFDEMTPRAFSDYAGGTRQEMLNRKILREAMEAEGFIVHPNEWWHFDHVDWQHYPIENISFEELQKA